MPPSVTFSQGIRRDEKRPRSEKPVASESYVTSENPAEYVRCIDQTTASGTRLTGKPARETHPWSCAREDHSEREGEDDHECRPNERRMQTMMFDRVIGDGDQQYDVRHYECGNGLVRIERRNREPRKGCRKYTDGGRQHEAPMMFGLASEIETGPDDDGELHDVENRDSEELKRGNRRSRRVSQSGCSDGGERADYDHESGDDCACDAEL